MGHLSSLLNGASLIWSCFFGLIGTGYAIYGKRQTELVFLSAGMVLMFYTFFVSATWLVVLIGAAATAAPFIADRWL